MCGIEWLFLKCKHTNDSVIRQVPPPPPPVPAGRIVTIRCRSLFLSGCERLLAFQSERLSDLSSSLKIEQCDFSVSDVTWNGGRAKSPVSVDRQCAREVGGGGGCMQFHHMCVLLSREGSGQANNGQTYEVSSSPFDT